MFWLFGKKVGRRRSSGIFIEMSSSCWRRMHWDIKALGSPSTIFRCANGPPYCSSHKYWFVILDIVYLFHYTSVYININFTISTIIGLFIYIKDSFSKCNQDFICKLSSLIKTAFEGPLMSVNMCNGFISK